MKALLAAVLFFSLTTNAFAQEDDHDKLDKLIAGTETFFDESTVGTIFFNYDEDGNPVKVAMDMAKVRQLVKDLKTVETVWAIDKAEKCTSLSLSTAAQGACLIRNLQLGLAHFFVNFQRTKKVLRGKGDEGIEAARKLSNSVKSMTVYRSVMCDLENASWWGGSGQGIVTYGCLMQVTEDGIKMLTNVRSMATDPLNQEVLNAQTIGKSTVLDVQTLQNDLINQQDYVKFMEEQVAQQITKFFVDFSEAGGTSTQALLVASTQLFNGMSTDYCSAYVAIVLPTFKDQSKYGDKVRMTCLSEINSNRGMDLNDVLSTMTTAE